MSGFDIQSIGDFIKGSVNDYVGRFKDISSLYKDSGKSFVKGNVVSAAPDMLVANAAFVSQLAAGSVTSGLVLDSYNKARDFLSAKYDDMKEKRSEIIADYKKGWSNVLDNSVAIQDSMLHGNMMGVQFNSTKAALSAVGQVLTTPIGGLEGKVAKGIAEKVDTKISSATRRLPFGVEDAKIVIDEMQF